MYTQALAIRQVTEAAMGSNGEGKGRQEEACSRQRWQREVGRGKGKEGVWGRKRKEGLEVQHSKLV